MNIELKIKINTLEELENVLVAEGLFCCMEIYHTSWYDTETKERNINIDGNIFKELLNVNKSGISFDVNPDSERYELLLSIEDLFRKNGIMFDTGYLLEGHKRDWHLDKIEGPMEIVFKE